MKFEESFMYFARKCKAQNLSMTTIEGYKFSVIGLAKFAAKHSLTEVESIKRLQMEDYFASLQGKFSSVTIKDKFVGLNAFFKYLVDAEILAVNPMEKMKAPKVAKKIIYAFSSDELNEIEDFYDQSTFLNMRNFTIIETLLGTGIRKAELLGLKITDFDKTMEFMRVLGKGNKERMVPIGVRLAKLLRRYMRERASYIKAKKLGNTASLFITQHCTPLKSSGLREIIDALKNSGRKWSTRVSAHTFRHTYGKLYIMNGGDVFTLQKILGHEDIATTRLYVDMDTSDIKTQNAKYNPLDNRGWLYS